MPPRLIEPQMCSQAVTATACGGEMAARLADVARRAGVSAATASRVLNNKLPMPIPERTVDRIRRGAHDLNYVPHRLARALATRRTHTLGFYSLEITDPHGAALL